MRVVGKTQALGALAGVPRACNERGSAQRVTSGTKVNIAARGRQNRGAAVAEVRPGAFVAARCRALSGRACRRAPGALAGALAAAAVGSPSAQVAPMTNPERVDRAEIRRHLGLIASPGQVLEVRAVGATSDRDYRQPHIIAGYFDDHDKLATAVANYITRAEGIYVTLNEINPALLARAYNRLADRLKPTTGDADILRRPRLLRGRGSGSSGPDQCDRCRACPGARPGAADQRVSAGAGGAGAAPGRQRERRPCAVAHRSAGG